MVSTRRTTLGAVSTNRARESLPGNFASSHRGIGGGNGKMKRKTTKSRMSMAPRVGGGGNNDLGDENTSDFLLQPKKSAGTSMPPTTPSRRKSMHVSSHAVSSQTNNNNNNNTARSDPRPINEKSFQNNCIRTIMNFLVDNGYEYSVSPKILSRPSAKDFNQIVTFLLRQVDPTFHNHNSSNSNNHHHHVNYDPNLSMKFEDEVAMAFKGLGYPFPISKTALVAAGSIHTWPTLLAALTWLIELLSCQNVMMEDINHIEEDDDDDGEQEPMNELDQTFGEMDIDGNKENMPKQTQQQQPLGMKLENILFKTEKRFFRYLADSYEAFLSSNDDQYDILEEQFLDDFERDNMKIEKEIERITDDNAGIVEKIDHLARNGLTLPELEKKREDLCTDLEKFHTLVNKFKEHKAALEQKVKDRDSEYQQTQEEVQKVKDRIVQLKQQIRDQEFSVEDVRQIEKERARIQETMERSGKHKQTYQKKVWECEMELKKNYNELDTVVSRYNTLAKQLLNQEFFYITVNTSHVDDLTDQSKFLGVDVKNSVIPTLSKLRDDYRKKISQSRKKRLDILAQVETSKKSIDVLTESVKVREEESAKIENTLKEEEKEQESTLTSRREEIKSLEEKTSSLRDPIALEASIERFQTQSVQLAGRRQQLRHEGAERKEAVQKEINDALSIIADHKEYIQTKLAELEEYANARLLTTDVEFTTGSEPL